MHAPEPRIRSQLRDGDVVRAIEQRPARPDNLQTVRVRRVVVQVERVVHRSVDGQLADTSVCLLFGEVGDADADEREGDGGVRRVRVG